LASQAFIFQHACIHRNVLGTSQVLWEFLQMSTELSLAFCRVSLDEMKTHVEFDISGDGVVNEEEAKVLLFCRMVFADFE
jgi:hypothetical protein